MTLQNWKSPSIKAIAQEAGVSPATVDRVLNGRQGVREVTRKKVENAMVLGHDMRREIEQCLAIFEQPLSERLPEDVKTPLLIYHRYSYFS